MDEFVGRLAELRLVAAALERARQTSGRLITVTGPGGVGKTRYCEEAADRARAAGAIVVWGRCWTAGGAPALWPWQSILSDLCGAGAAALLDGGDGDRHRFSRFVAVAERLAGACADRPVMVVVDDMHAADPGALLLTRFVARSLHRLPLILLTTHRPTEAGAESAPLLADLERDGLPVVLGAFDLSETQAFLAGSGVDPAGAAALHAVTRGNPLVLRRVLALRLANGTTPDGLTAIIDEALPQPAQRVLATTAVLGSSVTVTDAELVAGRAVHDVIRNAAKAGLVHLVGSESFTFSHDLVRQALADTLTPAARLDAHARAVDLIRGRNAHERQSGLLAHHAVKAAARSTADAVAAVDACRDAARSMARNFSYERAAALLATAIELFDSAGLGPVPAALLLDRAHAVHRCGRLAEARALFDRAALAAGAERDAVVFAEAALGLGGMWGNEDRDRVTRVRVVAMQRHALAQLPPQETLLRCRLATRLAVEPGRERGAYGSVDGVLDILEEARGTGDPRVLAEALSAAHHALLAPEHAATRLALADELISVASAAGMEVATLVSVCWRTVDLFHLGDPTAERSLTELRQRSELLTCHSVRYVLATLEVMLLIRAGELTAAEERAEHCLRLGIDVGDPDARHCHGAQLMTISWLRGHAADVVDLAERTADLPTLPDGEQVFHATLALLAAEAGRHDQARAALHRVTANGLTAIRPGSTWLGCLFGVVEAAATLGEADLARQAYDLLAPFAHRPVLPSMAVTCFGSVERTLGLAALTFDDVDAAVGHFERAVAANIRLANRPLTAYARADLATALRRRGRPGDRHRAAGLLDSAVTDATAMGMTDRAAAWAARRGQALELRPADDGWLLIHRGRVSHLDDLIGVRHLARLIIQPGTEISALDLAGGALFTEPANHAVLDGPARAAYARRARALAEKIADARQNSDLTAVGRLEAELDAVTAELERGTGINGRARHFPGPAERARTAVRKAITRAVDTIAATDPDAADTVRATVVTGYHCVYRPL